MIAFKFSDKFSEVLSDLFSNEKIVKIGHSIQTDMHEMESTLKLRPGLEIKNFIDLQLVYKETTCQDNFESLGQITEIVLGKKLSKYE